jgi:hypothetical protein
MAKTASNPARSSPRVIIICLVTAALSVFAIINSYDTSRHLARQMPDPYGVARTRERLEPLYSRVSAHRTLGYFSDLPAGETATTAFLAAQYALAPRLLVPVKAGHTPENAIALFFRSRDFAATTALGYEVVEDLGNGLVLFIRRKP